MDGGDIENGNDRGFNNPLTPLVKAPVPKRGCMRAKTAVGTLVNFIRVIVGLGMVATAITLFLTGNSVVPADRIQAVGNVLGVIALIGCVMVFFDASTAQFLVRVVLKELGLQVDRLNAENHRFENSNTVLESSVNDLKKQNSDLNDRIADLNAEIDELTTLVMNLQTIEAELEADVDQFDDALDNQKDQLAIALTQLNERERQLKEQDGMIASLSLVQRKSQELLIAYAQNDKSFGDTAGRLDDTVTQLENLISHVQHTQFEELDADGDGFITRAEHRRWSLSPKSTRKMSLFKE